MLLDLFALVVDDELGDRYPSRVADVGAVALVVVILIFSGWVRWVRGRLIHVNSSDLLAAPPGD